MSWDQRFKAANDEQAAAERAAQDTRQRDVDAHTLQLREGEKVLREIVAPVLAEVAQSANANGLSGEHRLVQSNVVFQGAGRIDAVTEAILGISGKGRSGPVKTLRFVQLPGTGSVSVSSNIEVVRNEPVAFSALTAERVRAEVEAFLDAALRT